MCNSHVASWTDGGWDVRGGREVRAVGIRRGSGCEEGWDVEVAATSSGSPGKAGNVIAAGRSCSN